MIKHYSFRFTNLNISLKAIIAVVAILTLSACDSLAPYTQLPPSTIASTYTANTTYDALWQTTAFDLVSMADKNTQNRDSSLYRVIAANKWLDEGKTNSAAIQLKLANPKHLDLFGETLLVLGSAKLAYQRQQYETAYQSFQDISLSNRSLQKLPESEMMTAYWVKANTLEAKGLKFDAAQTRIAIHNVLPSSNKERNMNSIWQLLQETPQATIEAQLLKSNSGNIQGWLDLTALAKDSAVPLEQKQNIQQWLQAWPNHGASDIAHSIIASLPSDNSSINDVFSSSSYDDMTPALFNQPKKIAVLIPLSGRLSHIGDTIRKGMEPAIENNKLDVSFFDTGLANSIADIHELISQAKSSNAEMIVGPLNKRWVNELANTPIPVLALNNPTIVKAPVKNHYYFGLNPEHEATQAGTTAASKGLKTAMIIYPNSSFGERLSKAFNDAFTANGGSVIASKDYNNSDNLNKLVEESLNEISSQSQRENAYKTQSSFGLDAVFMVASPIDARQIRPALTYYYANRVPIYSISSIYSKTKDYSNRDLRNVCIPDTILIDDYSASSAMQDRYPDMTPFSLRLMAFGEDSIELSQKLHATNVMSDENIMSGKTGNLSIQLNNQVIRQMPWYRFNGEQLLLDVDKRCSTIQ